MEKRRRRIGVAKATRPSQPRRRTGMNHQPLPEQRRRESKDPDHREEKVTRRRSTTMSAVKREAAKLLEIAYPYHDDIAISDRSQKLRRRERKAHVHPIKRATKDCSSM